MILPATSAIIMVILNSIWLKLISPWIYSRKVPFRLMVLLMICSESVSTDVKMTRRGWVTIQSVLTRNELIEEHLEQPHHAIPPMSG